jgi:hypothetical protein
MAVDLDLGRPEVEAAQEQDHRGRVAVSAGVGLGLRDPSEMWLGGDP